jgi:hypothetical protein
MISRDARFMLVMIERMLSQDQFAIGFARHRLVSSRYCESPFFFNACTTFMAAPLGTMIHDWHASPRTARWGFHQEQGEIPKRLRRR